MDAKPTHSNSRPRRGFTLVEMLVVVLIIGILAGLITAAAFKAMDRAKLTVIKLDCNQLDMAMNAYKDKYGDYPPDFWGVDRVADNDTSDPVCNAARSAVVRHLRKAFPRYIPGRLLGHTGTEWERVCQDVADYVGGPTPGFRDLKPASAIVFWLGGMPALDNSKTLTGFSANPENPFAVGGSRTEKLFEFDETRLVGFNGTLATPTWEVWPTYVPEGIRVRYPGNSMPEENVPYVYFKARMDANSGRTEYAYYDTSPPHSPPPPCGTGPMWPFRYEHPTGLARGAARNVCVPYIADATGDPRIAATVRRWKNPTSFQIIAPGLDANFGGFDRVANQYQPCDTFRRSENGANFTEGDLDNVTNFSKGKLEDEIKQ